MKDKQKCFACSHSYMEPDSDLICGHKDAGGFGKVIRKDNITHCKDADKFEQHPLRNKDGSLKK